ncbi:MAG: endonuclease/exonuclease/phosphatase family protein [Thermoleophilia bacterium]|nr:endonuclease/exonuclease/phosphatase family protein [Thermoleophilia bacterium]
MGDLQVDHYVRFAREPARGASLPAVDLPEHEPALPDRFGDQVRARLPLVVGGAVAGAATLATIATRSGAPVFARIVDGIAGAIAGASTVALGGVAFDSIAQRGQTRRSTAPQASGDVRASGEHLRVMTFNVHGGTGEFGSSFGGPQELEGIAAAIEREHPDVVLLQEVNDFSVEDGFDDMLASLADRLDPDGAVSTPVVRNATGRQFGNAVLTFNGTTIDDARALLSPDPQGDGAVRRGVAIVDTVYAAVESAVRGHGSRPLGTTQYRPRSTSDVLVRTPAGTSVRVLAGHFGWAEGGIDIPRRQVDPTAALLGAWDGPTMLGADFNVRSGTRNGDLEATAFAAAGMHDAFTQLGYATDDPRRGSFGSGRTGGAPIDRVYASRQLQARDIHVATYPDGEPAASDHRPVVVDYTITGDRSG